MRKLKKLALLSLTVVIILCSSASASEIPKDTTIDLGQANKQIEQRVEQTEWVYRYYNGKLQRRLWWITYGEWLTDWIDCKP
mgnify:FL=1